MNKQTALWLMIGGAAVSAYDMFGKDNPVYGVGKPLEKMRWEIYKGSDNKPVFISISDIAALTGAFFYFR